MAPDYLYRGAEIQSLRANELSRGRVTGEQIDVWTFSEEHDRGDVMAKKPQSVESDASHDTVNIVGGFTDNYGAAVHFSGGYQDFPVLYALRNNAALDVQRINYNLQFMHMNEGVLAHIDTLSDGEVRYGGRVVGVINDGTVSDWGQSNMESTATSPMYSEEDEYYASAPFVNVESSVNGSVSILFTGATAPNVEPAMKEYVDELPYDWRELRNLFYDDDFAQEAANILSEAFGPEIEQFSGEHYVIIVSPKFRMSKVDQRVDPEMREHVESVGRNGRATTLDAVPDHLFPT
mgnify:CR=1 FL=1